jgi:hypothetical protein
MERVARELRRLAREIEGKGIPGQFAIGDKYDTKDGGSLIVDDIRLVGLSRKPMAFVKFTITTADGKRSKDEQKVEEIVDTYFK